MVPDPALPDPYPIRSLQALELVDVRTQMLPMDRFRRDVLDDHAFVREAWSQRRNSHIRQGTPDPAKQ